MRRILLISILCFLAVVFSRCKNVHLCRRVFRRGRYVLRVRFLPWSFVLCTSLVTMGCSTSVTVSGDQIILPVRTLVQIQEGRASYDSELRFREESKPYKWIHYDGPEHCSICMLKQYYLWDELILHLGEEQIEYCFILESTKDYPIQELARALNEKYFSHPVLIDSTGIFRFQNGISTSRGSADIITDSGGHVLLAGDLRNNVSFYYRVLKRIDLS